MRALGTAYWVGNFISLAFPLVFRLRFRPFRRFHGSHKAQPQSTRAQRDGGNILEAYRSGAASEGFGRNQDHRDVDAANARRQGAGKSFGSSWPNLVRHGKKVFLRRFLNIQQSILIRKFSFVQIFTFLFGRKILFSPHPSFEVKSLTKAPPE